MLIIKYCYNYLEACICYTPSSLAILTYFSHFELATSAGANFEGYIHSYVKI
jgi:hypothetical protein